MKLTKMPAKKVAVALANKQRCIAWAILAKGGTYRAPGGGSRVGNSNHTGHECGGGLVGARVSSVLEFMHKSGRTTTLVGGHCLLATRYNIAFL
jgi:hypothetical protein